MADRHNFYFRQVVNETDLDNSNDKLEIADWNIVEEILGYGFLLDATNVATVEENPGGADLNVQVNQLLGYGKLGRRLTNEDQSLQGGNKLGAAPVLVDMSVDENGASTEVTNSGEEKILTIFVEFTRDQTDQRQDGNLNNIFYLQDESVQYNVVQSAQASVGNAVAPPARTDQLILADITIGFNQTQIQNADIDQSRREDFTFNLTHGSSHTENGTDPIPNATGSDGGLLSSSDKTKLDGITFTATGVASLFDNQAKLSKMTNINAPSASQEDVSTEMSGETAGGSSSVEGVVTTAPNNRVIVRDSDGDAFEDDSGDVVYGRITESGGTWTLKFYVLEEGVGEQLFDMTPFSGQTVQWWVHKTYTLENLPTFNTLSLVDEDEVAGGVGFFAQDNGGSPIGDKFSTLKEGSNINFSDLGNSILEIASDTTNNLKFGGVLIEENDLTLTGGSANASIGSGLTVSSGTMSHSAKWIVIYGACIHLHNDTGQDATADINIPFNIDGGQQGEIVARQNKVSIANLGGGIVADEADFQVVRVLNPSLPTGSNHTFDFGTATGSGASDPVIKNRWIVVIGA